MIILHLNEIFLYISETAGLSIQFKHLLIQHNQSIKDFLGDKFNQPEI